MQLDQYRQKLEAYVRGAVATAAKKGKVSRLSVSWSGPFWSRVNNLVWDATTSGGEVARAREDSLGVAVEPTKELAALLKKNPSLEGFFIEGGANGLAGYHETPPGEYGLWVMALVDDAIQSTGKQLAAELRKQKIVFTLEGHDGDGPSSPSHYLDRIPEARKESQCLPPPPFLEAFLRLFTRDTKAWLARAKRIKAPKRASWSNYWLVKIERNQRAERHQIDIDMRDKSVLETRQVLGSTETISFKKLGTPTLAREHAEAIIQKRRAEGFVGSPDEHRIELDAFLQTEKVLPVRAAFIMQLGKRDLDATAALVRWANSGDREKVRLVYALMPDYNGLERAAYDAWERVKKPQEEYTNDESLVLSAAATAALGRLLAEVKQANLDGSGTILWSFRMRIKKSKAPTHAAWRLLKPR